MGSARNRIRVEPSIRLSNAEPLHSICQVLGLVFAGAAWMGRSEGSYRSECSIAFAGAGAQRLRIIDDFRPVGQGASAARYVLAENGSEYLIKGPVLTPQYPFVAANEHVAAELAEALGLPILDHQIVQYSGQACFASSRMPSGTFYPYIDANLFALCENRDQRRRPRRARHMDLQLRSARGHPHGDQRREQAVQRDISCL